MKKKIIILGISVFLVIALLVTGIFSVFFSFKRYDTQVTVDKDAQVIELTGQEDLKILHLSDVQVCHFLEFPLAFAKVKKTVRKADPDLIVLTGDNVTDNSSKFVVNSFINFFDSFGIPWLPVYGNHDINSQVSPDELAEKFENSKYGLFKKGEIEGRYGNYYYNIVRNGEINFTLYFLDSKNDYILSEQVEWYKNSVNTVTAQNNGEVVPSFLFFHIPLQETAKAYEMYLNGEVEGSGECRSRVRTQSVNTGLFETALSLNSTKAMFYGHDHENNFFADYQGIKLCYALKSTFTVYYDRDMLGGNLITVKPDTSFTIERIFT